MTTEISQSPTQEAQTVPPVAEPSPTAPFTPSRSYASATALYRAYSLVMDQSQIWGILTAPATSILSASASDELEVDGYSAIKIDDLTTTMGDKKYTQIKGANSIPTKPLKAFLALAKAMDLSPLFFAHPSAPLIIVGRPASGDNVTVCLIAQKINSD